MTRKKWILANLEGKVQLRALRAVEEQLDWVDRFLLSSVAFLFDWSYTKEGHNYWAAIHKNLPNPDQYLPKDYVDVDDEPKSVDINYIKLEDLIRKIETHIETTEECIENHSLPQYVIDLLVADNALFIQILDKLKQ